MTELDRQCFVFGGWVFDVDRAQELIVGAPRPAVEVEIAPWVRAYGLTAPKGTAPLLGVGPGFDRAYAMGTDLTVPLILATLEDEAGKAYSLLIDGTHRCYRAHVEARTHLRGYVLTTTESLAIRSRIRPKRR